MRESNECFQALADDIRVRQADLVGKDFPGRIKQGLRGEG
jgi:hypothetical protein